MAGEEADVRDSAGRLLRKVRVVRETPTQVVAVDASLASPCRADEVRFRKSDGRLSPQYGGRADRDQRIDVSDARRDAQTP